MPYEQPPEFLDREQQIRNWLVSQGQKRMLPPPAETPKPAAAPIASIDDGPLRKALAAEDPGFITGLKSLGRAFVQTATNPGEIPGAIGEFAKGAGSGATLGLSELVPGLGVDKESWAGSAGKLAGFAVPGTGAAKGVRLASTALLPASVAKYAGSVLGSNVLGGAVLGPTDEAVRSRVEGRENDQNPLVSAAVGAAIPLAAHGIFAAVRRVFGSTVKPPVNPVSQTVQPIDVVMPEIKKAYEAYVREGTRPEVPVAPRGRQPDTVAYITNRGTYEFSTPENMKVTGGKAPKGFPRTTFGEGAGTPDTAPLGGFASGMNAVTGAGEDVTIKATRPGAPLPSAAVPETARGGFAAPADAVEGPPQLRQTAGAAGGAAPPVGPPQAPSGAPEPAAPNPLGDLTFWEKSKAVAQAGLLKANLPIRVLARDPETLPTWKALLNYTYQRAIEEKGMVQDVQHAIGKENPNGAWTSQMKEFHKETWLNNQGSDPATVQATLQQFPGTPQQVQSLLWGDNLLRKTAETWREAAVSRGLLEENQQIEQHLPWLRYKATRLGEVKVELDHGPQTVDYANQSMREHPRGRSFMFRTRNQEGVPQKSKDLSFDELWEIKVKGLARAFSFHDQVVLGGKGEQGIVGETAGGQPRYWIDQQLNSITDPKLKEYAADLVEHAAGVPKGGAQATQFAGWVRAMQFNHLIAGNFLTPLVNLTQSLVTLSRVSTSNWGKAWKLLAQNTPHEDFRAPGSNEPMLPRLFAEQHLGASGTFNKADEEMVGRRLLGSEALGKLRDQLARPFRFSEMTNQRHAAIAGYLEAKSRGLSGEAAMDFAKNINAYTQQFGGVVNTPEMFQGPIGSMAGQFKSYPLGFMGVLKDLFADATTGANMLLSGQATRFNPITQQNETALMHMKPLIKFMVATGALGGPAAFTRMFGEEYAKQLVDYTNQQFHINLPQWTRAGLLGYLGADLSNQLGFGGLPISGNMQDLMWFLPGPALSNVMDGVTVASYLADKAGINSVFTPSSDVRHGFSVGQNFGSPISPDDFLSRASRAFFPIGGPQVDRFRKYAKNLQSGGKEIDAQNLLQALGWEIPTGDMLRYAPEPAPISQQLGLPREVDAARQLVVQPLGRPEAIRARQQDVEYRKAYADGERTYHSLLAGGQLMQAEAYKREFLKKHGFPLEDSETALQNAFERRMMPAEMRLRQRAPWPVGAYERWTQ